MAHQRLLPSPSVPKLACFTEQTSHIVGIVTCNTDKNSMKKKKKKKRKKRKRKKN